MQPLVEKSNLVWMQDPPEARNYRTVIAEGVWPDQKAFRGGQKIGAALIGLIRDQIELGK